ncbi:cytochrome ubiquinol oxidase subunit I [Paenibacillus chondroitinus]|uniref:Cytochrome ubiquinol oxidase subunit I n=1 Tax=Paenibacillus chondroitinus TaxID=59842 RepID=A0ABU6DGZ8_9BACL|nr:MULTISPECIES: cytochrome ubiquinol oxidase subunit I [Paenibacillus]MCY9659643.1 cytochrome ubiquinol oxidase subunit I [Paenibacillus anseongense]MEB4797039.1 cytochrome ubiquinol oxidase subunit I [Paenibacillus chondroitinus]
MFANDPVIYSRALMSLTFVFHIIFATIGVGTPVLIALAEWMGICRNDPHYTLMARRWTRGYVITVAVGVVSGTALGLQINLLWPNFMRIAGQAIGLPMFMEIFAFFFEAIFLGIYMYTWDRFKPKIHFLFIVPVVIGASCSALFITLVNSFMNAPQGFEIVDGIIGNVQPLKAMFTPASPTKVSHVLVSAYLTSAFIIAGNAAYALLKGKRHIYYKKVLNMTLFAALVFAISTFLIGDLSGKYLAKYQPEKLAAGEWHFETMSHAPLIVGGILTETHEIKYGWKIPFALSVLAHGNPESEVKGLNDFPADEIPPLWIHYTFDAMVGIGGYLTSIPLLFILAFWFRKGNPYNKLLLAAIVIGAPLAMFAIEYGWIYAEVGRQPWILRGYMKTQQGATTSEHVGLLFVVFLALYVILGISCLRVLLKMFKNNTPEDELKLQNKESAFK